MSSANLNEPEINLTDLTDRAKRSLEIYADEVECLFLNFINSYTAEYGKQKDDIVSKIEKIKALIASGGKELISERKAEVFQSKKKIEEETKRIEEELSEAVKLRSTSCEDERKKWVKTKTETLTLLNTEHSTILNKRKDDRNQLLEYSDTDKRQLLEEREKYETLFKNERRLRRSVGVELMDLKGNIHVFCKVRPILQVEFENKDNQDCMLYPLEGSISIQVNKCYNK